MSRLRGVEAAIPSLRRYARSLARNAAEAEDLVQDTLLRALARAHRHDGEGDLRPWLLRIMHNLHVSGWRRLRRWRSVAIEELDAEPASAGGQSGRLELRDALRGLRSLPEEQRQVLMLVAVEGLDYAEAARVLGVPPGTVMSRLSRGRDRLRAFMEDGGEGTERHDRPRLRVVR